MTRVVIQFHLEQGPGVVDGAYGGDPGGTIPEDSAVPLEREGVVGDEEGVRDLVEVEGETVDSTWHVPSWRRDGSDSRDDGSKNYISARFMKYNPSCYNSISAAK